MSSNKSFFERLTGTVNLSNSGNNNQRQQPRQHQQQRHMNPQQPQRSQSQQPQTNKQRSLSGDDFEKQPQNQPPARSQQPQNTPGQPHQDEWGQAEPAQAKGAEETGELAVDVYETPNQIVIQTMVAGVRPEKLDVAISREECTISGRRQPPRDVPPEDYHTEELYWGAFSRTVSLPTEIEIEEAQANESHGLLTITLPKVDRHQETTLEIN